MKKLIVPAFCLSLFFASPTSVAANQISNVVVSVINDDERQAVKPEELPESIKKALATDDYKGWAVKDAALVKQPAAGTTAASSYYEVTLTKGTESKAFKFHQDGSAVK